MTLLTKVVKHDRASPSRHGGARVGGGEAIMDPKPPKIRSNWYVPPPRQKRGLYEVRDSVNTDLTLLLADLSSRYGDDAAQEAMIALLNRTTPLVGPNAALKYARLVAKRHVIYQYRRDHFRGHTGVSTTNTELRVVHVSPGPGEQARRDATFGSVEPEQERRLLAREELRNLDPSYIEQGMGYLDPSPQDPIPGKRLYQRQKWEKFIKRRRK